MLLKNKYHNKWLRPRPTKLKGAVKWVIVGEECCVSMGLTLNRCGTTAEN
jgi:hypothetical protein